MSGVLSFLVSAAGVKVSYDNGLAMANRNHQVVDRATHLQKHYINDTVQAVSACIVCGCSLEYACNVGLRPRCKHLHVILPGPTHLVPVNRASCFSAGEKRIWINT